MKTKITLCAVALAALGLAHDEPKGKPVTITGTVVDTGCYMSHDAIGEKHADCARMAYQARVAIDRIKFAIKHTEQFARPCDTMREVGMQLLDALERLESLDRRFQARSRLSNPHRNGNSKPAVASA
jgi:hypothetical protein